MNSPPVVDYARMKYLAPEIVKSKYNTMTWVCIFFIFTGILVLIKRYKDRLGRSK